MKIYKRFWLGKKAAPGLLYQAALLFAPERMAGGDLRIEASSGQTVRLWKLAMLVVLSRAFGLRRTVGGDAGSYGYEVVRDYEESDFATRELMFLGGHPTKYQIDHDRDAQGRLLLNKEFMRELRLGSAWNHIVVAHEMRQHLERASLIGLRFREAAARGKGPIAEGPFWELQSSVVLPRMANTHQMKYVGMRGAPATPFAGDYSRMVFLDEPPYRSGEIHYRRSDLTRLGQFDVAETFELYRQPHRVLIVSQRFYQTCLRNGIQLHAEPVRIDPE